jgi:hypothetical protein
MSVPIAEPPSLLHSVKNNVSVEPPGVGFSIQSKLVGNCETSLAVFDDRSVDLNARQALAANSGKDRGPSKLDEAAEWLEELLGNGPMAATDVKAKARADRWEKC